MDIYGWMGSLAVYGFLTVYFLVAAALPIYLRRNGQLTPAALTLSIAAALAMILAMAGTLYPVPTEPLQLPPLPLPRLPHPWPHLVHHRPPPPHPPHLTRLSTKTVILSCGHPPPKLSS